MIINIPLQINEESMEEVIKRDYEEKVLKKITEYIKTALVRKSGSAYGDKAFDGMIVIIESKVGDLLKENKEAIIKVAANLLAERLAKTKKAKEILNNLEDQNGPDSSRESVERTSRTV